MQIEICKQCNGTGTITIDEGFHSSEYVHQICKQCNGTGRVKTDQYKFTVPFDTDDKLIYKLDEEIINLIRQFELKH